LDIRLQVDKMRRAKILFLIPELNPNEWRLSMHVFADLFTSFVSAMSKPFNMMTKYIELVLDLIVS
jgi:hypothetical protein